MGRESRVSYPIPVQTATPGQFPEDHMTTFSGAELVNSGALGSPMELPAWAITPPSQNKALG